MVRLLNKLSPEQVDILRGLSESRLIQLRSLMTQNQTKFTSFKQIVDDDTFAVITKLTDAQIDMLLTRPTGRFLSSRELSRSFEERLRMFVKERENFGLPHETAFTTDR